MFSVLKKNVGLNFNELIKPQLAYERLFTVEVDREKVWELYLNGFSTPEEKQHHNCNCCKSFLRQYSGIVVINKDNIKRTLWDFEDVPDEFKNSIKAIKDYIHSLPISNVFVTNQAKLGTNKSTDPKKNLIWEHFSIELPRRLVYTGSASIEVVMAEVRDNKSVLKRSLDELTLDSCDTVLELIKQKSLYRGNEFEGLVKSFRNLLEEYGSIPNALEDNYCWRVSLPAGEALCKIRNSAIGTLLVSLSEGEDLDAAVGAFERMVAPANYKRPTSLVTPKMVEEAKNKLTELGLLSSLERRYATPQDVSVEQLLFIDKSSDIKDVFDEMAKGMPVNPKTLSKMEEITIEDFINKIIPTSKSVEALVENIHINNAVSLLTAADKDAPTLFKWPNPFSWAYTNGVADSMKERVKAAGGRVDGVLRFSIQWNEDGMSICDLDAHAHEPDGTHIYYGNHCHARPTSMTGVLDVDMINPSQVGVENITWSDITKMKEGDYKFSIHNFNNGRNSGFTAQVEFDGQVYEFGSNRYLSGHQPIAVVTYSKKNGFSIKGSMDSTVNVHSKEKWGVKTNQFVKVKNIMLSPNYWSGAGAKHFFGGVGNKHYFFMLEGCINDEQPRPFFNEFLKEDLSKDRKVFEILSSKLSIPKSNTQLSGLGFSDTQRNHLIVRVNGAFKRNLKVTF